MRRALIGYTGFVGKTLCQQSRFTDRYNSQNFHEMADQHYDEIVCAGIQSLKWWANQNPDADWRDIDALLGVISTVSADRFILISTVDVYKEPVGVDENTMLDTYGLHPYGSHRLRAENAIRKQFHNHLILRLPGLFGHGLKKNLIYDSLTGADLSGFDGRSQFQFYNLVHLHDDISRLLEHDVSTVNLASEPVDAAVVVERISGKSWQYQTVQPPVKYDMQTIYGGLWGEIGPYIYTAETTLDEIAAFATHWQSQKAK